PGSRAHQRGRLQPGGRSADREMGRLIAGRVDGRAVAGEGAVDPDRALAVHADVVGGANGSVDLHLVLGVPTGQTELDASVLAPRVGGPSVAAVEDDDLVVRRD